MMRRAIITVKGIKAGLLIEDEHGYEFVYDPSYAQQPTAQFEIVRGVVNKMLVIK